MNNVKNRYISELKQLFPFHDANIRKLILAISQDIDELAMSSSQLSYEDICREIGSPHTICYSYLESLDGQVLSQKISFNQFKKRSVAIIITIIILVLSCEATWFYHLYRQAENALPAYYEEQISDVQT